MDTIRRKRLFFLIVEFAVAIAFEVFVLNLLTEFLAHTFVFRKFTDLAWTIAVLLAEAFLNLFYNRFVLVKSYFHNPPSMKRATAILAVAFFCLFFDVMNSVAESFTFVRLFFNRFIGFFKSVVEHNDFYERERFFKIGIICDLQKCGCIAET